MSLPGLNELAERVREAGHAAAIDLAQREEYAKQLLEFADALFGAHEYEDAAEASADAMKIFATLAERGEASPLELGAAMRRHADALSELGQDELAIDLYRQTLGVFGSFKRDDTPAQAEFAGTLLNFGACLRRAGRAEEALHPLDQARELFGTIGFGEGEAGDPTLLPSLALAQVSRARVLAELGREAESLRAIQEAEAIYAEFASEMADVHGLSFAKALDAHASISRGFGRFEEAVELGRRALRAVGELARADAARYIHPLSRMANNLARALQQAGRLEEAEPMFARAAEGFGILADAQPRAHRLTQIRVLSNHALAQAQCGRLEQAYARTQEAIELARVQQDGEGRSLLIGGLHFASELATDLGRLDDAARHLEEALRGVAELLAGQPDPDPGEPGEGLQAVAKQMKSELAALVRLRGGA